MDRQRRARSRLDALEWEKPGPVCDSPLFPLYQAGLAIVLLHQVPRPTERMTRSAPDTLRLLVFQSPSEPIGHSKAGSRNRLRDSARLPRVDLGSVAADGPELSCLFGLGNPSRVDAARDFCQGSSWRLSCDCGSCSFAPLPTDGNIGGESNAVYGVWEYVMYTSLLVIHSRLEQAR